MKGFNGFENCGLCYRLWPRGVNLAAAASSGALLARMHACYMGFRLVMHALLSTMELQLAWHTRGRQLCVAGVCHTGC